MTRALQGRAALAALALVASQLAAGNAWAQKEPAPPGGSHMSCDENTITITMPSQ